MQFYWVDVFAAEKYGGNQLAVFLGNPEEATMQRIARETNFSETTFITRTEAVEEGAYEVRIFTPKREVPFAGHPVLGTAYVLIKEVLKSKAQSIKLKLRAGMIEVKARYDEGGSMESLVMRQLPPRFGVEVDKGRIAKALGINPEDLSGRLPAQEVSTGLPFVIVPVRKLEAIERIKVDLAEYYALITSLEAKALLVFCPEVVDKQNHLHVRMFADAYGIAEDPATGSGCGCLAAFLVKTRFFGGNMISLRAEQGMEMGRPSLLYLRAEEHSKDEIDVQVGGKVIPIASGQWL